MQTPSQNQTKILVRDFIVPALIGIYPHEQTNMQRIKISVEATLKNYLIAHDDINDTMSYEGIVDEIRSLSKKHFNLVEILAEHLAQFTLSDPRVDAVQVRVEKLDVYPEGSVGTEIFRSRS